MRSIPLILASSSPRRVDLLKQVSIHFETFRPFTIEIQKPFEDPQKMVKRLAQEKAQSVVQIISQIKKEFLILAADTVVVAPNRKQVLGKPTSMEEAQSMLRLLSGKWHTVFTGYCMLRIGKFKKTITRAIQSQVKIRRLSASQISSYVLSKEPMDKAGAYAAQGLGMAFIEEIQGSYTNVVGLPLSHVLSDLEKEFKIPFLSWLKT